MAISADIRALPFKTRERVCRATPNTSAPSVTVKPNGSKQASLIEWPGCGGIFIAICVISFLVVVHQINIEFIAVFEPEYDAPVTADADAPVRFLIALERVQAISGKVNVPAARASPIGSTVTI